MPQTVKREEFTELKGEVDHLRENIRLLFNPKVLKGLEEAKERINQGKGISLDEEN